MTDTVTTPSTPDPQDAAPREHLDLADVLRSLALDIVDYKLPLPDYTFYFRACLPSREDVQAWADHFHTSITMLGDYPVAMQDIEFGDGRKVQVVMQAPAEPAPDPEKAELAARVAELEAQIAQGGVR